jgi:uncharacterized protein YecE (DUF72 family)
VIYVGTSGFSYSDWVGPFYPSGTAQGDFLAHYAQRFPTVEINYTYYAPPQAATLEAMARKVGPGFRFTVKATSTVTHEREATAEFFAGFQEALDPLSEREALACVLVQFPHSFGNTKPHRAWLAHVREQWAELPLVVEFRHRDWIAEPVFDFLTELGYGFCCVDQPQFKRLVPPVAVATSHLGYVRFHGRNYEKWWKHDEAWERYDYLYRREELEEWVPRVRRLVAETAEVLIYFNNHYEAQAAQNADLFANMLVEAGLETATAPPA